MTRSQNSQDPAQDHADEALIPKWVKTAGAVVGIVVALIGAFGGISQVLISLKQIENNIQQERLQTQQAQAKEAEENRKKAEIEKQRVESEAAAIQKVKEAEALKEEAAAKAIKLNLDKEIETKTLEESFKVKQEARIQKNNENLNFEGALSSLFKNDGRPLASLAALSKYTMPKDERLPNILTSLVAKLDEVEQPSEVNIIFQLFEKAGPGALGSVIDSNRNALERYKSDCKKLALHQLNLDRKILLAQLGNSTEPIPLFSLLEKIDFDSDEYTGSRHWSCRIGARTYRGRVESNYILLRLELPLEDMPIDSFSRNLALRLAILRQSKRSLARLLMQTRDSVDLGGADLSGLKLLPGAYSAIDFSEAFVAGADFSNAQLDPASLKTLGDAYITRESKVKPNLHSLKLRLTSKQVAAIQSGA